MFRTSRDRYEKQQWGRVEDPYLVNKNNNIPKFLNLARQHNDDYSRRNNWS
jgi:hypothetical protein